MKFENAYKELMAGKRIRRKEWEPLMHIMLNKGKPIAYRGEYTKYIGEIEMLVSDGWMLRNSMGEEFDFLEAINQLRQKQQLTNKAWEGQDKFLFLDNDNELALCSPVGYSFMPTFKCLCANDWEVMK